MAVYLKIYTTFTHQFWPEKLEVFYLAGNEIKGRWGRWRIWRTKNKETVLICKIVDDEAKRVEKLSDEAIKDEIELYLNKAFEPIMRE